MTTAHRTQPSARLHHQVVDAGHHCNYSQVPHSLLDDVANGNIQPSALVLYIHLLRVSWEQHGQPVAETLRETKCRTGLGNGTILAARTALASAGWIGVQFEGHGRHQLATITLADRWRDNCPGNQAGGQNLTTAESCGRNPASGGQNPATGGQNLTTAHLKNAVKTKDVKDLTPLTPAGGIGEGDVRDGREVPLPDMATISVTPSTPPGPQDLVEGFYRGLGIAPRTSTTRVRKRELAIARDLVAVGATPREAEAYARETNGPRRLAAVDMATFERERASWLARRSGSRGATSTSSPSAYQHDPWQGRRPPIAEEDLARSAI